MFLAINYLHSNNIVHQDIKKKNISIIKLDEEKENQIQKLDYKNSFKKDIKRLKSEKIIFYNPIKYKDDIFIKINEDKEVQREYMNNKLIKNLNPKRKLCLDKIINNNQRNQVQNKIKLNKIDRRYKNG